MRTAKRLFAAAGIVAVLALLVPLRVAAGVACSCDDLAQIQYRIMEDNAAIAAFEDLLLKAPEPGNLRQSDWERFVQDHLDAFAGTKVLLSPFPGGEQAVTKEVDLWPDYFFLFGATSCLTSLPPDFMSAHTPCMQRALLIHEEVHRTFCERSKAGGHYHTYRVTAPEELEAYQTEQRFLLDERKRLLCNCDYYALKLEQTDMLGESSSEQHWQLWNTATAQVPFARTQFVQIPLQVTDGNVSGNGSGAIDVSMKESGPVTPCNTTSQPTAGTETTTGHFDTTFAIKGRLSSQFKPVLTTTMGNFVGETTCVNQTSSSRSSGSLNTAGSTGFPLSFAALDSPSDYSNGNQYEHTDFKATLVVNDKWKNVTASDHRGSTVEQALHVIGLAVDC